jgi:hypothetical protein
MFPGGDGEKDLDEEETAQQNKQQDLGRLNSFIQKAGQVGAFLQRHAITVYHRHWILVPDEVRDDVM